MIFNFSKDIPEYENALLSQHTTFRLGGPCRSLIKCEEPNQLRLVVSRLSAEGLPFIVIGGGSNLIVSNNGVDVYVIRFQADEPMVEKNGRDAIEVSGSTNLTDLVFFALENSLEGVNYLAGIPGTVGGAVAGNAGAFGRQIGDVVESGAILSSSGEVRRVGQNDFGFSYRESSLKHSGDILLSVNLKLTHGDPHALREEHGQFMDMRRIKHPDWRQEPCAGSVFKNVEPSSSSDRRQSAGWFLEEAGVRDLPQKGVQISSKHANILVNLDRGSSQEAYEMIGEMKRLVKNKFQIDLEREIRLVGEFFPMPENIESIIW